MAKELVLREGSSAPGGFDAWREAVGPLEPRNDREVR